LENRDEIKKRWFSALLEANKGTEHIDSLSSAFGDLTMEEAYEVQDMMVKERLKKGERVIGWKIGSTSRAVMDQLNISEPVLGCMTTRSEYSFLNEVKASHFCRLAVEGEIAFVMGKPLKGPGITKTDVIQATAGIMGAVELVDCRITDWKATTTEAIADNALHGGITLGPFMRPISGLDLIHEGVVMHRNGHLLASACGVEALGDPVNVVVWLANKLGALGKELGAGAVVSTGSLTRFFFVDPGDVIDVCFTNLGRIHFSIEE
jgi:2-keto-4-pentenoate hydratase